MKKKCLLWILLYGILMPQISYSDYKELMEKVRNTNPQWKYYYVMPEERQEIFFKNLEKIEMGDSYEKVVKLLGEPYAYLQESHWLFGNVMYYTLKYYIKKIRKSTPDPFNDLPVGFSFNRNNKLFSISGLELGVQSYDESLDAPRGLWDNFLIFRQESKEKDKAQEKDKNNTSPEKK